MNRSGSEIRLYSKTGTLYAIGDMMEKSPQNILPDTGLCQSQLLKGMDGQHYLLLSGRVTEEKDPLFLQIAYDISNLYETRSFQQAVFLRIFAVAIILCAFLSYTLSRLLTSPLDRLSHASRAVASGQYNCRIPVCSDDEIGEVSMDFNLMASVLEQNIAQLQQAVEQQERFLGSFAHELKTPMTTLIGYAEMLYSESMTEQERTETARYIYTASKRLDTLWRKLLKLLVLKNEDLPFTAVSPKELLTDMLEELKPIFAPIQLSFQGQDGLCLLEPDLFRSLLLNLLDNAHKSIDQEGNIYVVQAMLLDGCRIVVHDDGRGIPSKSLSQLTQPFYRVDKARSRKSGGSGLGLSICREIVQMHHGTMNFSSSVGKGTSVTIELKGGRA